MAPECEPSNSAPLAALALADREQLRITLKPSMTKATFANWLFRQQRDHGFPAPVRTGSRGCAWLVSEVAAWLQGRPRGGVFAGRRRSEAAA